MYPTDLCNFTCLIVLISCTITFFPKCISPLQGTCSFNSLSTAFALCHTSQPASWSFPGKLSQLQGEQDAFEQDISEHVSVRAEPMRPGPTMPITIPIGVDGKVAQTRLRCRSSPRLQYTSSCLLALVLAHFPGLTEGSLPSWCPIHSLTHPPSTGHLTHGAVDWMRLEVEGPCNGENPLWWPRPRIPPMGMDPWTKVCCTSGASGHSLNTFG